MMKSVFLLQHVRANGANEDVKVLGIFETEERAERCVNELKKKPGFSNHPDGFHIDKYDLDKAYWQEGFGG